MISEYKKKQFILALLIASIALTIFLHYSINPSTGEKLTSQSQLDSLILQAAYDFSLGPNVRTQTIEFDSLFTRKNYMISVPPGFSKTTFHMHLQRKLYPYQTEIYGQVRFPERNLDLHVMYNNTVHRSIFLRTDPDLTFQKELNIPGF